ncbi:MAG: acyltransferase [Ruminococcus sp.]|nr:acyltransferase [Ruminococcus sp.]
MVYKFGEEKMNANNSQRGFNINSISKYRGSIMGVAIVGILLCHYNECRTIQGLSPSVLSKVLGLGCCFVDVFLILSGVGLYYSFSKNNDVAAFYKRRLLRLLPTYLIIAVPYWIYHDMFLEGGSIVTALYNLSFGSLLAEGVQRFWFVFLILILYLIFPLVYKALDVKRSVKRILLVAILAFLVLGGVLLNQLVPEFYSNIRIAFE